MTKVIWIDLETTGVSYNNDCIIELAVKYEDKLFHKYCLPDQRTPDYEVIEELTGITYDFLEKNGIPEKELYIEFLEFLNSIIDPFDKNDKAVFSAYKADFDNNFIRALFKRYENNFFGSYFYNVNLDVMSSVAEWIIAKGKPSELANFKLSSVCEYFKIPLIAHSAKEDIEATVKLYNKLKEI